MEAKVFALATMSIRFFIALPDIQIVSASLGEIGGGLSAGLAAVAAGFRGFAQLFAVAPTVTLTLGGLARSD